MKVQRSDLAKIFPGHWDGGDSEFHGLLKAKGVELRVECLQRDELWGVSVFQGGAALATATDADIRKAVAISLREALRAL